jgi:hypothetical protein
VRVAARAMEVFQRLNRQEAATVGAEELTPEEVPFLRFDPAAATGTSPSVSGAPCRSNIRRLKTQAVG